LLTRYRGLLVLVAILALQLVMLGLQVRNQSEVRLLRVWAVTAVTPFATILEGIRAGVGDTVASYVDLRGARTENTALRKQLGDLRRQNDFLRAELETAQRADALLEFRQRILSRTVAARVIGANAAPSSRVMFIDRGASDGLMTGMAVVTAQGVVGRVLDVYRNTAQVMLITDPSFAMGVVSQKGRVVGTLKGLGQRRAAVDYVENHLIVEKGEWFYSSGDDRMFPRGLPVGPASEVTEGGGFKEILVEPAGMLQGVDEVLIVLEAMHQAVPEVESAVPTLLAPPRQPEQEASPEVSMFETAAPHAMDEDTAASPDASSPAAPAAKRPPATDADRLLERYRRIGASQGHVYGTGLPGSTPPDFNRPPTAPAAAADAQPSTQQPSTQQPATQQPAANEAQPQDSRPAGAAARPNPAEAP
jgi:rod shape-determining protein MreC